MGISLSIIVPTLNSYLLLPRLLRSLKEQTFNNWRLVFIDGPSCSEHRLWLSDYCESDPRFCCYEQDPGEPGIFGAMNHGFSISDPNDWLLFWGSDDWAAGPTVLADAVAEIKATRFAPDLLVCTGRYVSAENGHLARPSVFHVSTRLSGASYRRTLFLGSTPPHQATLIGPGARTLLSRYASCYRLSADLDYFLKLSQNADLQVQCSDLELVHMSDAGVSGQHTLRRLKEVHSAYLTAFGVFWLIPFLLRYIRRLSSLIGFNQ